MAHRTDSADARHQRRHFVEWTTVAQLLKAAELRYVKASLFNSAVLVKVQRDLGMTFDACHRIDDDGVALLHDVSLLAMI